MAPIDAPIDDSVDQFDFPLPEDRIAQFPASPRDSARLLTVGPGGLADRQVRDLPGLLAPGDMLVFNDTRVIPARLTGTRGAAKISLTLHKRVNDHMWWAFAKPAKRLKVDDTVIFAADFAADVLEKGTDGQVLLGFTVSGADLWAALETHGIMPLPPYIKRPQGGDNRDRDSYQTLFAEKEGAVAAPTAGLHFTPALMAALEDRGILTARITLHVGAGTFLPVKADRVGDHKMHAEWGEISADTAAAVNKARAAGGRIVSVGTTSLRLLESAADDTGHLAPFSGETDIFITPGYRFKIVDRLMTNFHLPRSTLFMLVSAFSGLAPMKAAYAHAIAAEYRFYSYGDACLLEREATP
ncbi:MAG: tRNA preQ1(34) S-adenosylmethionine ribosyltransferase-isomerase QueA [Magnetospiraceae bacterium]